MATTIYSSICIDNNGKTKLHIIREAGIFEKKYFITESGFDLLGYENINDIINDIQEQTSKVFRSKRKYKWKEYDIRNLRYYDNVTITKAGIILILTNMNESTLISLYKMKYDNISDLDTSSYINLNGLSKFSILIDPYIEYDEGDSEFVVFAKLYSENGNMFGIISQEYDIASTSPTIEFAKSEIQNMLLNADSKILLSTHKKDVVLVSSNAYLFDIKK